MRASTEEEQGGSWRRGGRGAVEEANDGVCALLKEVFEGVGVVVGFEELVGEAQEGEEEDLGGGAGGGLGGALEGEEGVVDVLDEAVEVGLVAVGEDLEGLAGDVNGDGVGHGWGGLVRGDEGSGGG
jgi:hypothetical protein